MTSGARTKALLKLAYFGPAYVPGAPVYFAPQVTVGQTMTNLNAMSAIPPDVRRSALDQIVSTGLDVNSPVKKLLRAGVGALAGNLISKAIGFGPFGRGVATTLGANYGYGS